MNTEIPEQVEFALNALYEGTDDLLVEYRVLGAPRNGTMSGYFDDITQLVRVADRYDSKGNSYIVINPVDPELKGRSYNKLKQHSKVVTKDEEVRCRRYILLDFDPKRPSGIASNDEEHSAALKRARKAQRILQSDYEFPDMFRADSGNGAHLLIPCDLPNNSEVTQLIKKFLSAANCLFTTDKVLVDMSVYNAARLTRLYGTLNAKGDDLPDRPHRYSRLLYVPEEWSPVSRDAILRVIEASGIENLDSKALSEGQTKDCDLKAFIEKYDVGVHQIEEADDCTKYHLEQCPFNPEHREKDSALVQFKNGAIGFHCFHDSCSDKKWRDVRALYQGDDDELERECAACELSDLGNGYRLILRYGKTFLYVDVAKTWYVWNGWYWEPDRIGQMLDIAGKTAQRIKDTEAKTIQPDYDEDGNIDWRRRNAHEAFGVTSENINRREAMLKSARCDFRIGRTTDDWDSDPSVLCVANGTIELLNGGLLRPHDRNDMITRMLGVTYDPKAKCPNWTRYLRRVVPDKEERRFLQKYVGYCLTGLTTEQCFLMIYGIGHNGKSVFVETIQELLSPFHFHTSAKVVMQVGSSREEYALAQLPGMRLVTLDELGARDVLNESVIKNMTGNDRIACRHPCGRPFSFVPQFKLIIYGNHRPRIIGTDNGIWRRPKLVHFSQKISMSERDTELPIKFRQEISGILSWAVRGCLRWQEEGLEEPESMKLNLKQYRSDMDTFQQFIDESVLATENESDMIGGQQLYDHYKRWCERSGHKAFSISNLNSRMLDKGFKKAHKKKGNVWVSLTLCPSDDFDFIPRY